MNIDGTIGVVGANELVTVAGISHIPAKIDTGADSSSIWASSIDVKEDGTLTFCLFGPESSLYTGKPIETRDYGVKVVRSSHGDEQIRYRVKMPLTLQGHTFETTFTIADRSRNNFPVLIGRRTLSGKFLVDVSKSSVQHPPNLKSPHLNREMQADPYEFHRKYFNQKGQQ